jgi:hypothetical protein
MRTPDHYDLAAHIRRTIPPAEDFDRDDIKDGEAEMLDTLERQAMKEAA